MGTFSTARGATASATRLLYNIPQLWDGWRFWNHAAVLMGGGQILWVGPASEAPSADHREDAEGALCMPGLVDCHSHSLFAGTRLGDFIKRQQGSDYASLLEGGGGIHRTVRQTRAAPTEQLHALLLHRLSEMQKGGVTTVEIKSGYGLSVADELRMLQVIQAVGAESTVQVIPTFLGAHAIPPERDREDYVQEVIHRQLPVCAPYVEALDVYCDRGAFTLSETERLLRAGLSHNLKIKVHAEQVSHTGAAALAASLGACSADHLERIDAAGMAALAAAGTVAVLLPGAMLHLKDSPPPVAQLRAAGVPMAVATDFNPGSSPLQSLWAAATLSVLCMGLGLEEALAGITRVAADALGHPELGRLAPGAQADLCFFRPPLGEAEDLRVLLQYMGPHSAVSVWKRGERVS